MARIKRNELLNITFYVISITLYIILSVLLYLSLNKVNPYYLFVIIPSLFLFTILSLSELIKIIITLLLLLFRNNGNYTSEEKMYIAIDKINIMTKYTLIAIFIALLISIMILDITLCLVKGEMLILSISIVVWFLIGYFLYGFISNKIRNKIRE